MNATMTMTAIYHNPTDYPGKYVTRTLFIFPGRVVPCKHPRAVTETLKAARAAVPKAHDFRIPRDPNDEPQIVETWL